MLGYAGEVEKPLVVLYSDMTQTVYLCLASAKLTLNDTEALSLPVVSSPLFSVFGLNPKGPEALFDAWFFVP